MVTPYPLLLFGGEIVVKHELMTICIDDWIEFRSPGKVAVLIKQLRAVSVHTTVFVCMVSPATH